MRQNTQVVPVVVRHFCRYGFSFTTDRFLTNIAEMIGVIAFLFFLLPRVNRLSRRINRFLSCKSHRISESLNCTGKNHNSCSVDFPQTFATQDGFTRPNMNLYGLKPDRKFGYLVCNFLYLLYCLEVSKSILFGFDSRRLHQFYPVKSTIYRFQTLCHFHFVASYCKFF